MYRYIFPRSCSIYLTESLECYFSLSKRMWEIWLLKEMKGQSFSCLNNLNYVNWKLSSKTFLFDLQVKYFIISKICLVKIISSQKSSYNSYEVSDLALECWENSSNKKFSNIYYERRKFSVNTPVVWQAVIWKR